MQYTELPGVEKSISALGLGTYETLCYMEYRDIVELVTAAVDVGVTLFDVAHYPRAPHTEIVLMRALSDAGLERDQYSLVTKVWGRDDRSMETQLDESLYRLGTDYVDGVLCYGPRWDIGDPVAHASEAAGLVETGRARWWGGLNWSAADLNVGREGLFSGDRPDPVLMQMKYNMARRNVVESSEYLTLWGTGRVLLQASDSLEGGVLAGKSDSTRVLGRDPGGIRDQIREIVPQLKVVADEFRISMAEMAVIFAAGFPHVGNVLVGSSRPEQLRANARAIDLVSELGSSVRDRLDEFNIAGHRLDVPPGTIVDASESPYVDA